jgi:hypothetical protein
MTSICCCKTAKMMRKTWVADCNLHLKLVGGVIVERVIKCCLFCTNIITSFLTLSRLGSVEFHFCAYLFNTASVICNNVAV